MTAGTGQMPSSSSAADVKSGSARIAPAAIGNGEGPISAGGGNKAGGEAIDEVLILRLRGGETAAGEVLVRRYYAPLMRYLQRLAGSDHLAEELHQQTWLSVLDHIEKFDPAASGQGGFKAWLFRIATNKANDLWRSRGRERAAKEGLRLISETEGPAAGSRMEGTEQELRLREAIDKLPEPQRQVLLLRYYSNLKFVEIAELLGCPLNTALGRMHKAMLKLKQMMEN
jgi:RNA polymerase sigma-70 factor (ECF subfamily)